MIHSANNNRWRVHESHTHTSRKEEQILRKFIFSFLLTSVWTTAVLCLSRSATEQGNLWLVIIAALLITFPALMAMLYTNTIKLIHESTKYKKDGHLKRRTIRRIFTTIILSVWAIVFGFATVFWLSSAEKLEVTLLYLSIGILYLSNKQLFKITYFEIEDYHSNASSIRWSRIFAALVMTAVFLSTTLFFDPKSTPASLTEKFSALAHIPIDPQQSYLVQLATKASAYVQEFRYHLVSFIKTITNMYIVAIALGTFLIFLNFNFFISGFLITPIEYRRIFLPLSTCPVPAQVPMSTTIFASTIVTLFFFLFLPLVSSLELFVRNKLLDTEIIVDAEKRLLIIAEKIDGTLYAVGTLDKVNEAMIATLDEQHVSVIKIRKKAEIAFDGMRQNVDAYLDNYYSLPAEYMRIIKTVSGTIEKQITEDLTKTLMDNQAVEDLDKSIKSALESRPQVFADYTNRVSTILEQNHIEDPVGHVVIVASSAVNPLMSPPENAVLVTFNQRMGAAGVGAVGGIIAAKIVSKVAAKGVIKLAAKSMAKVATSKVAGGAAGAAIGAAIGSVVPIAGTAVGAAIGFATGVAMGVAIDAGLLQLEEIYSREEFKAQILEAIDEQEREFNAMLST